MKIRAQRLGRAVVFELQGQLTATANTTQLDELVRQVARLNVDNVVLNLEHVRRLDCAGIGQLVRLHGTVRESGATLKLVNVDPRQKRILELLQAHRVLTICGSLEEALPGRGSLTRRVSRGRPRGLATTAEEPHTDPRIVSWLAPTAGSLDAG